MLIAVDDFTKFRLLLLVIVLSLGFEGAKQGWYYLLTAPGQPNPNSLPFLGDNNGVALGMLMLIPTIVLLDRTTQRAWARCFYWLLLIGVLYRALSTFSRGGFLACGLMALLFWLYSSQKLRFLLVLLLVGGIIVSSLPSSFWNRMQTVTTDREDMDDSALGRLHFWEVASVMARSNPILGVGFNAYNAAYDAYDFSNGQYGNRRSVHSTFFGVMAELGYLGLILYMLILFLAFKSCQHVVALARTFPTLAYLGFSAKAFQISLAVFVVGGSFLPFQYSEMLWHYITFCFIIERISLLALESTTKV